ncbi:hypothetical protein QJS10_CPB17g01399 [Acorus calamus]|uniref:Uncharacterized protein n=1 Tax=Acorus calamus TaxID=4465 RepID=A0AAV9CTK4_ACOCL|nr:hypothetical protein QJS10_CPB17g01399 [Acorus calamus]
MQEASKSVDVSKPLPENVLRSFLSDIEFMNAFLELCSDRNCSTREATPLVVKPTAESGKSLAVSQHLKATISSGECMKEEFKSENASDDDIHTEKIKECLVPLPNGKQILSSSLKESPVPEVNDTEALGLLGWLASSQAAEDLNLDDELVHEAILSPLLPKNTFGEVLEKACLDYESASQQECQDILDSVEVDVQDKSLTAQAESNIDCRNMICSSKKVIPQVDGLCGDQFETLQMGESSETNVDTGGKKLSSDQMKKGAEPLFRSKNRGIDCYGASDDLEYASASSTEITAGKFKVDTDSASSSGSEVDKSNDFSKFDRDNCHLREEKLLNRCSTRDLMRRKRHSRVERSGDEALKIKKLAPEALRPDWKILNPDIGGQKAQNDIETSGAGRCAPGASEQGCRLVLDDCNSTRIMELPSSSFSDLSMRFNMSLKSLLVTMKETMRGKVLELQ